MIPDTQTYVSAELARGTVGTILDSFELELVWKSEGNLPRRSITRNDRPNSRSSDIGGRRNP